MLVLLPAPSFGQNAAAYPDSQKAFFDSGYLTISCLNYHVHGEHKASYEVVLKQISNTAPILFETTNVKKVNDCASLNVFRVGDVIPAAAFIESCDSHYITPPNPFQPPYLTHIVILKSPPPEPGSADFLTGPPCLWGGELTGVAVNYSFMNGTKVRSEYFFSMIFEKTDEVGRFVFRLNPELVKL